MIVKPHDNTERMLLLKDGKIVKEMQGLHVNKKNQKCPHCGSSIQTNDDKCPNLQKTYLRKLMNFSHVKIKNKLKNHFNLRISLWKLHLSLSPSLPPPPQKTKRFSTVVIIVLFL